MRILVCGSHKAVDRYYRDQVFKFLDAMHKVTPIEHVVTGGAEGIDTHAADWAKERGIERVIVKADWDRYGKSAGPIRNARMIRWRPHMVLAFPGSTGTQNMVEQARKAHIPVYYAMTEEQVPFA